MRNDKHLAEKLRRKNKSYNQISQELDISKSTLAYWFKDKGWSKKIKKELSQKALRIASKQLRLMNKAKAEKWEKWREEHRQEAHKKFPSLKNNSLFLAGLMLYWGEGDSKIENCQVRLSNTDPEMIRMFSNFLQQTCLVPLEKIRCSLILYPDLKDQKCKTFWSQVSGIPETQFTKTQFIQGRHPTKRLTRGICMINTCSRALKEKIFVWIKLYQKELGK